MRNFRIHWICFLLCVLCISAGASELVLLSNNIKPGRFTEDFPEGTKVLPTEMTHSFVTEGDFATDPESVKTGGGKKLFDGNAGSNWKSVSYSKWGGGKWVTVNLDFKQKYLISKVDVWVIHEATRDSDSFELCFSKDGKSYVPQATAKMDEKIEKKRKSYVKMTVTLEQPVLAQYVQVRIHRKGSAKQQQVADIAVWGQKSKEGVTYLDAGTRPKVTFNVQKIQSGVALVKWHEFMPMAKGVKRWKIYQSSSPFKSVKEKGVTLIKSVSAKNMQAVLYPFTPGESFFFGDERSL